LEQAQGIGFIIFSQNMAVLPCKLTHWGFQKRLCWLHGFSNKFFRIVTMIFLCH